MTRPWVVRAPTTYIDPEVEPDLYALAEDGLAFRDLRGLYVRPRARVALREWRSVVWRSLGEDSPDDPVSDGNAGQGEITMLNVRSLATITGLDPSGIRRVCRRGGLQGRKVRGEWVIDERDAERWLEARKGNR